jgi:hypothetical protein
MELNRINNPMVQQRSMENEHMKKKPVCSIPATAVEPDLQDPFAWPRRPTPPLVQVPFDFEAVETEGDTPCD